MSLTCGTKTNILRTKNITVVKVRRFQMVLYMFQARKGQTWSVLSFDRIKHL